MASEATKEPHWGALRGLCAPQEGGPCGSCWRCADASPALGRWKPWFSPGSSNLRARETYVNAVCFNILFLLCPVPTGRINYFERKQIFWLRCIAGRAACTKCGRARNTQGAVERGSRRGKRIKVWQSREGRRAEHVPLPGASRLEARPAGESAAVGLPAPAGGSAAPSALAAAQLSTHWF